MHVCCAPCAIYPHKFLSGEGFDIAALFYNPNIFPPYEFVRRRDEVGKYARYSGLKVEYEKSAPGEFLSRLDNCFERPARCRACWNIRLEKTALKAKLSGCDFFTSTLLVSPYQDFETIAGLGRDLAIKHGVKFIDRDFRPGFKEAHEIARAQGLYCQKYCGCSFSFTERFSSKPG